MNVVGGYPGHPHPALLHEPFLFGGGGAAEGAPADGEPEQRLRRAARVHPQRAGRHQAVQDQDAAPGHQLHRLPHGGAGQGPAGRRGLQGRAQEGRAPRRQEEARAAV